MGTAQKPDEGRREDHVIKTAAVGAIGFMIGAGTMLMPGSQKWKRQAQRQVDKLVKMTKTW